VHDYAFYYRENRKQMLLLLAPSPSIHVYKPQSLKLLDATSPIKTKPHRGHPWLVALAFPPLHRHSCSTSPPYRHPRLLHRRQQRQRLFSSPPPSTWLLKRRRLLLSRQRSLPRRRSSSHSLNRQQGRRAGLGHRRRPTPSTSPP